MRNYSITILASGEIQEMLIENFPTRIISYYSHIYCLSLEKSKGIKILLYNFAKVAITLYHLNNAYINFVTYIIFYSYTYCIHVNTFG